MEIIILIHAIWILEIKKFPETGTDHYYAFLGYNELSSDFRKQDLKVTLTGALV